MKRSRIEKPKVRRECWWQEVLPLDPRDPDVARAKAIRSALGVSPAWKRPGSPSEYGKDLATVRENRKRTS